MRKLIIDPMPQKIESAKVRVSTHFDSLDRAMESRERVWAYKKAEAQRVLDGGDVDPTFIAEAETRGLSLTEFAQLIMSKPDVSEDFKHRELARQKAMIRLESCKDLDQLAQAEASVRYYNGR